MSDTVEHLIDWAPVGAIVNAFGGDAGGGVMKMLGVNKDQPAPGVVNNTILTEKNSVESQAEQRRLARLSKYFTSPTGVMDSTTGSQGVF